jgi:hypothetical protein
MEYSHPQYQSQQQWHYVGHNQAYPHQGQHVPVWDHARGPSGQGLGYHTRHPEHKPRLSKDEVELLEGEFRKNSKPNTQLKKGLAEQMGVEVARINNWFQNRRAKAKQEKRIAEQEAESNKAEAQAQVSELFGDSKQSDALRPSSAPLPPFAGSSSSSTAVSSADVVAQSIERDDAVSPSRSPYTLPAMIWSQPYPPSWPVFDSAAPTTTQEPSSASPSLLSSPRSNLSASPRSGSYQRPSATTTTTTSVAARRNNAPRLAPLGTGRVHKAVSTGQLGELKTGAAMLDFDRFVAVGGPRHDAPPTPDTPVLAGPPSMTSSRTATTAGSISPAHDEPYASAPLYISEPIETTPPTTPGFAQPMYGAAAGSHASYDYAQDHHHHHHLHTGAYDGGYASPTHGYFAPPATAQPTTPSYVSQDPMASFQAYPGYWPKPTAGNKADPYESYY